VFALDEEGEAGQDETTIKPETQQLYMSLETSFTTADVVLADGSAKTGMITLENTIPSGLDVLDGRDWWSVQRGPDSKWETVDETWLPEGERRPGVSLRDKNIFPLSVKSRLPRSDGNFMALRILPNGITELSWSGNP
jgi:hypothetical protein